jgi:hypothetical protein
MRTGPWFRGMPGTGCARRRMPAPRGRNQGPIQVKFEPAPARASHAGRYFSLDAGYGQSLSRRGVASLPTHVPMKVDVKGVGAGQPGQQIPQLRGLFAGERGQELGFMLFRDTAQCYQHLPALGG